MNLSDLPEANEIIEKTTPNYSWASFADAEGSGMGMEEGNDARGFSSLAGEYLDGIQGMEMTS